MPTVSHKKGNFWGGVGVGGEHTRGIVACEHLFRLLYFLICKIYQSLVSKGGKAIGKHSYSL